MKERFDCDPIPDLPDEVPVADAVEQSRPAVESEDLPPPGSGAEIPLESNESDWQEQHEIVGGFDEDEFR